MTNDDDQSRAERLRALRREPPRFRRVEVRSVDEVTPRLCRILVGGDALDGFDPPEPAASVRVLLPPERGDLVIPEWTGNEFRLRDGSRPLIRTLTPRRFDPVARELAVDLVVHGDGAAAAWVRRAAPGDAVAVSGPGRGYTIDPAASSFLLAGDETALPAISQLLEALPDVPVQVLVEIGAAEARHDLPHHPQAAVAWLQLADHEGPGDALVPAVAAADIAEGTAVWVAGEAAAVQRIRGHLFDERDVPRSRATVRGYWKHGRAAGGPGDD